MTIPISKLIRYAISIIFIFPAYSALAADVNMGRLFGTPDQIGQSWSEINGQAVVREMDATYLKRAAKAGISKATLIQRGEKSRRIVSRIAPHWLAEARAMAKAAGLDEELFLAYCWSVSRGNFLHKSKDAAKGKKIEAGEIVECTSYALPRGRTAGGQLLFHKTRDNVDRPQVAVLVESSLEGINSFIAVTNIGHLYGLSMMVNDKGLAGSADYPAHRKKDSSTLKLPKAAPRYRGIMSGDMLRYIAERASTAAQALAIVEDFIAKGYYAGSDVNGSHWLFVDREGTILEICNNAEHVVSRIHSKGVYFSRLNKSKPVVRLREADKVNFQMFQDAFRRRPILTGQSISAMTVEIDPDHPHLLTTAWVSLPARSAAFPIFMGQRGTPSVLLDGTAYALGKKTSTNGKAWEEHKKRVRTLESTMHKDKQALLKEIKQSIAAGNPPQAEIEKLQNWSREQASTLTRKLSKDSK